MNRFRHWSTVALVAISLQAAPLAAQPVNVQGLVTTVVIAKTPPGASRAAVEEGMAKAVPSYQQIPGLLRKFFTISDGSYGGVYLWTNRAAAEAWFTPDFIAKVKARSGVEPQILYFDSPIQLDNRASR